MVRPISKNNSCYFDVLVILTAIKICFSQCRIVMQLRNRYVFLEGCSWGGSLILIQTADAMNTNYKYANHEKNLEDIVFNSQQVYLELEKSSTSISTNQDNFNGNRPAPINGLTYLGFQPWTTFYWYTSSQAKFNKGSWNLKMVSFDRSFENKSYIIIQYFSICSSFGSIV